MIVRLTEIAKSYRLGRVIVRALSDITLDIQAGELIALAGPSGSGKTTLLNLIGLIDKPDAGHIILEGIDTTAAPLHRLAALRRHTLGFVFQTFNLLPVLTAFENAEYPLLLKGTPKRQRQDQIRYWRSGRSDARSPQGH